MAMLSKKSYSEINRMAMKSSYWTNMFLANLVVITLIIVPVCMYSIFYSSPEISLNNVIYKNVIIVDLSVQTPSTSKPTKRNIGGKSQSTNGFHGQFGIKLNIIPDNPIKPTPIVEMPKVYTLDGTKTLVDDYFSISDLDTGELGNYIPENADYVYESLIGEVFPNTTPKTLITRGPQLIHRVKPKIPPIAKDMGIGGIVEVLLLIDPKGNAANFAVHTADSNDTYPEFFLDVVLKNGNNATLEFYIDQQKNDLQYVTLKDSPEEFKFAEYLHEVLPQWRFRPAIKEGTPIYSFVYLYYNFCASTDEDCTELILSPL